MIVRHLYRRVGWNCRYFTSLTDETGKTCESYSRLQAEERDPAPFFFDNNVQEGLKALTRIDYSKVFRERMDGTKIGPPRLKYMTEEDLALAMRKASNEMKVRMQMPPMVKVRSPGGSVISKDPALQGFETSTVVFTDISYGISYRKRLFVVRQPDGTLRHATWDEKERYNQVYFPIEGREMRKPKMFDGEYLQSLLDRGEYEFVLDRACVQFDPDSPEYQRITRKVYSHINDAEKFESIQSTRHFGCLVFHLIWTNDIDTLLLHILGSGKSNDARILISLYRTIWPDSRTAQEPCADTSDYGFVLHYARCDSKKQERITRFVQTLKEMEAEKEKILNEIETASSADSPIDEKE